MARMFNSPHPGLTLRDDVWPALGLTGMQAAQHLLAPTLVYVESIHDSIRPYRPPERQMG